MPVEKDDVTLVSGVAMILGGLAYIYWPAALIAAGVILIGVAVRLHKPRSKP